MNSDGIEVSVVHDLANLAGGREVEESHTSRRGDIELDVDERALAAAPAEGVVDLCRQRAIEGLFQFRDHFLTEGVDPLQGLLQRLERFVDIRLTQRLKALP